MLYSNDSDRVPLTLIGGESARLDLIYRLRQRTVEGDPSLKQGEIVIGTDLAKKYSLIPGDKMLVNGGAGTTVSLLITGIVDL